MIIVAASSILTTLGFGAWVIVLGGLRPLDAQQETNAAPPATAGATPGATAPLDAVPATDYEIAARLRDEGRFDEALAKTNEVIAQDPSNSKAFILRGDLYAKKKLWDQAAQDFLTAQKLKPTDPMAKFDLAEIQLMQRQYDAARPGFSALMKDSDMGDLAAYKVFLCDLYGGHKEAAATELQAFDDASQHASYYYSHAAWALYNKQNAEARRWLRSALYIYTAQKNYNYSSTLRELGYLPVPPD